MGILDKFKGKKRGREPPAQNINYYTPFMWSAGDYSLSTSEAIFAAVTRISRSVAAVRCHLYQNRVIQYDHYLEKLVNYSPNMRQTAYSFQQTLEAFRNTDGNAYALIRPNWRGSPENLDILDPAKVEPVINDDTDELWYKLAPGANKPELFVHCSSIIHLKHVCTNGYKGISPVSVLRGTLDYDENVKRISIRQLESGINSAVTLHIPSEVSEDKKARIIASFLENYRKSKGQLIVLDAGTTADRLSGSAIDPKLLDVEKITKNRVATVYTLPPHMLGDFGGSSYSSNEQGTLEFLQFCLKPIFEEYSQEYGKKLLTPKERDSGLYFSFEVNKFLLSDMGARADYFSKAIRGGWLMPNEVRMSEGLPDAEGGNQLLAARDLLPLPAVQVLVADYARQLNIPEKGDENYQANTRNNG
ncbi:MAG: phage portal protein [Oscillospiraceae bacterium]|jgi:HK97 family phage portal protein|nr:phage portal protein [Oscillospiraceae bacterium]